jgi:hypothetical protein
MDWKIVDATGRVIMYAHINPDTEIKIDVSDLASGIYFGESHTKSAQGNSQWRTQFIKID